MSPTKSAVRTGLRWIFKFAIPTAIIGFLLWNFPAEKWQDLAETPKNYVWMSLAIVVAVGALSISYVRWCLLVRAQGIEITMLEAFRLGAIGFLLSFISAGSVGGDLFKGIFLARRRPGKRTAALASVVVDRFCGLFGLLILGAIGLSFAEFPNHQTELEATGLSIDRIRMLTYLCLGIGSGCLLMLICGGSFMDRWIKIGTDMRWIGEVVGRVGPPLRIFHQKRLSVIAAILMSVFVHGLLTASMTLIAWGLYEDAPTATQHGVIVPVVMLASALPLTPAGVGVLELAMEAMYRLVLPAGALASGTLVALVFEIVKIVVAALGVLFYWTAPPEVHESLSSAEAFSEDEPLENGAREDRSLEDGSLKDSPVVPFSEATDSPTDAVDCSDPRPEASDRFPVKPVSG